MRRDRAEIERIERFVNRLPDDAQRAFLWLLRVYAERTVNPSPELTAAIERVEEALRDGRAYELDLPIHSLLSH